MFKVLLCISTEHNWWLVGLAAMVCALATFAAFFLYSKVPTLPLWRRWAWLSMTGLVAGSGIWTTHFVGMLAFKTGLPTGYAALPTFGSLAVVILSTTAGLAVALAVPRAPRGMALMGGLVIGLGVTCMHYMGMAGYRTAGVLLWDQAYVLASVAVGAVLGPAALLVSRAGANLRSQALGAGLLSVGIIGMHFTGMTAVTILPDAGIGVPQSLVSDGAMVIAAVAVTALILLTATGGVILDAASRNRHFKRLRAALEAMPEALALYDASDRLVAWNMGYAELCGPSPMALTAGKPFGDIVRESLALGVFPDAAGREAEWIAERVAARRGSTPTRIQQNAGGRWLRITDRRTHDGGVVTVGVDITDLKRTEAAMAEARDHAEELARRAEAAEAVAGMGRWRLDAATRELVWSDQIYTIYGFAKDAPLSVEAVLARYHPEDRLAALARLGGQFAGSGTHENSVTRIVRTDGEARYVLGNSDVERGPDGEVVAIIGTVVDITAQKLAEIALTTSEERFRRLAVNAPDMITEFQLDGILTYVSPASLAVTGFTPEELVGRHFTSLMKPEDGAKVLAMCEAVFKSKGAIEPWKVEFRARHKTGGELWFECKPTFASDPITGRFTRLNDVVRDITPRKALEAKLRQAQAEAEAAVVVKADFLANMSHELRTPLTSIIGFTGLAAEQSDLSPLTRDYVDRVGNASRALLSTVNDILDFSKLEAGQVDIAPQPVSLARLSRATLDLFTPQAGAKDLTLTLDGDAAGDDLVLAVDPDRIRQILLNLVSNAVKFTAAGGVTLRTRYDAAAGRLRVEVIDTGAGIAPEKQERLFKRFSQIDGSLTRAQSGTGLGLAICKGLAEAMGGEIGVESAVGEGSRFWFEIPASTATLPETVAGVRGPAPACVAGLRVLVVDDNRANRELARLFLAAIGAEVAEAADGEEGARMAMERPYDAILMDVQMPRLDGPGALRRIRAGRGPNDLTPILAFTADADADSATRLLASGFTSIVGKPVEPQALIAALVLACAPAPARTALPASAATIAP